MSRAPWNTPHDLVRKMEQDNLRSYVRTGTWPAMNQRQRRKRERQVPSYGRRAR